MAKTVVLARLLNWVLVLILAAVALVFFTYTSLYGVLLALVTLMIAGGVLVCNRWAYFCAAAWGLAWFQLAKQDLEFVEFKRQAMILGILVIPLALFLHEKLGKKSRKEALNAGENDSKGRNMPE